MTDKLGVALVKYICPICGKEADSAIIVNKRLSKPQADKVNELNGKAIGFSEKPCKECQEWIDKGAFFIIGIDSDKTNDESNPYRTGHLVGIKKESEFYKDLDNKYKTHDFLFMDYRIMEQIGLIKKE